MYNKEIYFKELEERRILLEKLIGEVKQELPYLPQGNLRVQNKRGKPQFFHVTGDTRRAGDYITVENIELARKLAKKTYYEKFLKEAKREQRATSLYLRGVNGRSPEDVFSTMNDYRKELVIPLLMSDADYAKMWENMPYEKNPYHAEECTQPTDKGDLVRSKSEARIADMYYALGIPYRYEAPVKLKNGKIKYPDFTLLKLPERTEYYHEHMGLMEDEFYRSSNITKLNEYAESKIFTGNNLILTFETDYAPLNIKSLRKNVKEIFQA